MQQSALKSLLNKPQRTPSPTIQLRPLSPEQAESAKQVLEAYGDFWRHVKFAQKWSEPLFTREEVEDLLEMAAECVVRIRSLLDEQGGGLKLRMLDGSAREFLFMIDFHPQIDPERFVRELVHATFQDSKGYVENLSFELVDGYLDQILDPEKLTSPTLRLSNGIQKVEEMLRKLVETKDVLVSTGFGKVSEQNASHLLHQVQKVIESLAESEKALSSISESIGKDITDKSETDLSAACNETVDSIQDVSVETQMDSSSEPALSIEENAKEEQGMIIKVKHVADDVQVIWEKIGRLKASLKNVQVKSAEGANVDDQVKEMKKKCLEYSDILLQSLIALDEITGGEAVRSQRKKEVKHVQSLLDDIDTISNALKDIPAYVEPEMDMEDHLEEYWQKMKLEVQFRVEERQDAYLLSAHIPGMDADSVKLHLNEEQGTFAVTGMRIPSAEQVDEMRQVMRRRKPGLSADDINALILSAGAGRFGRFYKTYEIPSDTNPSMIEAVYRNGNLIVLVPKLPSYYTASPELPYYGARGQHPAFRTPSRGVYGNPNLWWM